MAAARPRRLVGVFALAVLALTGAADPAGAAPRADDPAVDPVVLIVHAAGDAAAVRAVAAAAGTRSSIDVRHTFPADHAFSVSVPATHRASVEAALRAVPGVTGIEAPVTRSWSVVPNDPRYGDEAGYLSSVHAPAAWDVTHGSRSVRIAVIDSGIDVRHPDLAGKISKTYNADNHTSTITDQVGHGTFVAGVAAAETNNLIGVAGAGYDTSLMGVKIAGPDGELSIDDEIAGINWAVANKADIINLSLGGTDYSSAEKAAVENAISHGVLVVAAAGNDGDDVKQYPAAYPGVIAVGAVDTATHRRASFSSHGSWVTLAAPGVGIESTSPLKGSDFFATTSGYTHADGTSFSAPLVAGEAALLKAVNPALTVAQLRQALTASAGGLAGQGLGAGLVDFAGALTHVPPTAGPLTTLAVGSADTVTFVAAAAAPAVEFRVDSGSWTAPVAAKPAGAGVNAATLPYATWGLANGGHTLYARACSVHGECNATEVSKPFTLDNTAPRVTSPTAGSTSTGLFTVTAEHPTGGGGRLLLDGTPAGFDATSPFTFPVNGSRLRDGTHTVSVVSCSTSGALCQGPVSAPTTITTSSLHPVISGLVKPAISPNGDHSGDIAALRYTLPDTEQVVVETRTAAGTVVRSADLGPLAKGAHTWTWRGLDDHGTRLRDGRYTIALRTAAPAGVPARAGYAATVGTVDTVAPTLSRPSGNGTTFYPVVDGYHDSFAPGVTVGEAGTLVLTVRSRRGAVVRTLSAARGPGRTSLTWNGRDGRGHLVAAGDYRYRYSIADAAGNRSSTASYRVDVSTKKLVHRVAYVTHRAATYRAAGGTDSCSRASKRGSAYRHGVTLRNACRPSTGDFAYAAYGFTLPRAIRYSTLTIQVFGRSAHRPSELSVAVDRIDGGIEIPAYAKVSRSGSHWHSVASVPASGHINGSRRAYATVLLTGRYRGVNDFDMKYARLRVSYTALG